MRTRAPHVGTNRVEGSARRRIVVHVSLGEPDAAHVEAVRPGDVAEGCADDQLGRASADVDHADARAPLEGAPPSAPRNVSLASRSPLATETSPESSFGLLSGTRGRSRSRAWRSSRRPRCARRRAHDLDRRSDRAPRGCAQSLRRRDAWFDRRRARGVISRALLDGDDFAIAELRDEHENLLVPMSIAATRITPRRASSARWRPGGSRSRRGGCASSLRSSAPRGYQRRDRDRRSRRRSSDAGSPPPSPFLLRTSGARSRNCVDLARAHHRQADVVLERAAVGRVVGVADDLVASASSRSACP